MLLIMKYYSGANKRKVHETNGIPHYNKTTSAIKHKKKKYYISTSSTAIYLNTSYLKFIIKSVRLSS